MYTPSGAKLLAFLDALIQLYRIIFTRAASWDESCSVHTDGLVSLVSGDLLPLPTALPPFPAIEGYPVDGGIGGRRGVARVLRTVGQHPRHQSLQYRQPTQNIGIHSLENGILGGCKRRGWGQLLQTRPRPLRVSRLVHLGRLQFECLQDLYSGIRDGGVNEQALSGGQIILIRHHGPRPLCRHVKKRGVGGIKYSLYHSRKNCEVPKG